MPDSEAYHVTADIGSYPNQPSLFMLLITKLRLLFQVTAKGILYGVLNVMLIAEYDDTDFIEGITVF